MKGTHANIDPIVDLYQRFYVKSNKLNGQVDDEVLDRLTAEYADDVKRGRDVDKVVDELTAKALRWQSKRQHSEACEFFNIAEMVATTPDITVSEACHKLGKFYYLANHKVKGDPQVLSQKYNQLYDNHYTKQIEARQVQAAKDLFGN
jgi:hypothetical protein